jgi:hypothetical protein
VTAGWLVLYGNRTHRQMQLRTSANWGRSWSEKRLMDDLIVEGEELFLARIDAHFGCGAYEVIQ